MVVVVVEALWSYDTWKAKHKPWSVRDTEPRALSSQIRAQKINCCSRQGRLLQIHADTGKGPHCGRAA